MDASRIAATVRTTWTSSIVPTLTEYIRVPALSPLFDPDWEKNGEIDRALRLLRAWCEQHAPNGAEFEEIRLPHRTPVLFAEIEGSAPGTVLIYGHLDKQPEMTGWTNGRGPWKPVLENGRLYGRGGADDGYAVFAALEAINALQREKMAHPRIVVLIEACEESGSPDLPAYLAHLAPRIGSCDLVVALDSTCGDYERLWCTTSLRGAVVGALTVELLTEGVHSGDASGVVASTFRVVRQLLDRLENSVTGEILPPWLHAEIPAVRIEQAKQASEILGDLARKFPFVEGARPVTGDPVEQVLNRSWRPTLSIVGADGLPSIAKAGNVLRPMTAVKVSLRLPPSLDGIAATQRVKELLESDPPYGARVRFEPRVPADGWDMPEAAPWLSKALEEASQKFFGRSCAYMGSGGSIPFLAALAKAHPQAQFLVTGVLGPNSNAHGPNEFLELRTAERLTASLAWIVGRMSAASKVRS